MMSMNPKIEDWRGRRIWIVGASSGIGAALARQLRGAGAHLALSARREPALREVAGPGDQVLPADVTDIDALESVRDLLIERWGSIDMVVYCAGVYTPMRAWNMDLGVVREALAINLQGVYNLLHAALPLLTREGAGGVCLVASVAGFTGLPKALAYGPAKAAMINLAQILYTDLRPRGVAVYLVNPGFVATRLTAKNDFTMPAVITPEQAAEAIVRGIASGRFEIHFPKRFTCWVKLLALLPDRLRLYLLGKVA